MRYGWDFEEYQVCVRESDFHVGKDGCARVPQTSRLGGPPAATGIPGRAQVLAQLVNWAKCHQRASVWWCRERARRRRAELHMEAVSQGQELQSFISSHLLIGLGAYVWHFSPNCSEVKHLKLAVKLRLQGMRNNQAALYIGTFEKYFHSRFWVHFHTVALHAVIANSPAWHWAEVKS